eukprot:COSAG06_NODE_1614_length_8932_cov_4.428507_1_plen_1634_part_10
MDPPPRRRACFCLAKGRPAPDDGAPRRNELGKLKTSQLHRLALGAGVAAEEVEAALDSDSAKDDLVALLLEHESQARERLRQELAPLRLAALHQRAIVAGADAEAADEALEARDARATLVELILQTSADANHCQQSPDPPKQQTGGTDADRPPVDAGVQRLQNELSGMKLMVLQQRAVAEGVAATQLEDAMEATAPKDAVIQLIHDAVGARKTQDDRPHFGEKMRQSTSKKPPSGILPAGKHAMISYQWDDQERVTAARQSLTKLGVPCWMDVDGGMQQDIYESMASGVENAACVVCFLSQKYQDSENCKLELKFAKQSGVPIVPVMVESTRGWRPSGWLGIVVAGALWTSLRGDESEFEDSVRSLVEQIKGAVPGSGEGVSDDEDMYEAEGGSDAGAETRAELERLRRQIASRESQPAVKDTSSFDPESPAELPVGVPELPSDFRRTSEIEKLLQNLLHGTMSVSVGFWGMGGIGKTVTGAALVRDAEARDHFDQIVWLPLGQTPVMEKLQSSALDQLIGKSMESTLSEEERHEALRDAFKGKRVLLALDDLWEEEHSTQLNFVDESCGSRVLISTRIRHLLADAFAVEIGKPSMDDSISILKAAAELDGTSDAPSEAAEIVELCGRLPLALVMAGKLILELEVGDKWDGITSILRDELRGNEAATSREQGVIRASLAGLKGNERDTTGARQLFKLFGLVPEDTSCPLECLQMMFDAVYEPPKATPILLIRKWLKQLIDRSLVLGTVDRASLHDLVLDFTISLHSKDELVGAHRRVVEAFRKNRVENAAGIRAWSPVNRDDLVTVYVLDEITHHVRSCRDPSSDEVMLELLTDQPQDVLHQSIGMILGEAALVAAAESSGRRGDMWACACRWACAAYVARMLRGQVVCVPHLRSAIDALGQARESKSVSSDLSMQMDRLELGVIADLCMFDMEFIGEAADRLRHLASCKAGSAEPVRAFMLMGIAAITHMFAAELNAYADAMSLAVSFLAREGCVAAPDVAEREFCSVMLAGCMIHAETYTLSDSFDMAAIVGSDGELLREGLRGYNYDKHHQALILRNSNDLFNMTVIHGATLALRFGSLGDMRYAFDKVASNMKRSMAEANQIPERLTHHVLVCCHWPSVLNLGNEMAALISELGMTWAAAEAKCDAMTDDEDNNPYFAPRGKSNTGPYLWNMDLLYWTSRLNYVLCAPRGAVPHDEVVRSLSSLTPELLTEYCLKSKDAPGDCSHGCLHQWVGISPHLIAAMAAEKYDLLDQALAFVAIIHEASPIRGGDHKPSAHILGNCVKGRVLHRRGQIKQAAAAFEAAVEQAEKAEMPLLVAFALRDLRLLLDEIGHGDYGSRRLGAVLRQLKDPPEEFSALLGGLDTRALARLSAPEASYQVVYQETEHLSTSTLRDELATLRLKGLCDKAKQLGVEEDTLEDALDAEDSKSAVIALILAANEAAVDMDSELAQPEAALRAELDGLRLKALRKRARDAGIDGEAIEDTTDSHNPKGALIELLIASAKPDSDGGLLAELQGLTLKHLRKRAKDAGATAEQLLEAMDADEPKDAVIELILAIDGPSSQVPDAAAVEQRLLTELQGMRLRDLRKRAKEVGVGSDALENAMDSDEPEATVVELIVARTRSVGKDKPHF